MLGLRAASSAARMGFFEGAPALRARDSLVTLRVPGFDAGIFCF
jgi:hypothetical protein